MSDWVSANGEIRTSRKVWRLNQISKNFNIKLHINIIQKGHENIPFHQRSGFLFRLFIIRRQLLATGEFRLFLENNLNERSKLMEYTVIFV